MASLPPTAEDWGSKIMVSLQRCANFTIFGFGLSPIQAKLVSGGIFQTAHAHGGAAGFCGLRHCRRPPWVPAWGQECLRDHGTSASPPLGSITQASEPREKQRLAPPGGKSVQGSMAQVRVPPLKSTTQASEPRETQQTCNLRRKKSKRIFGGPFADQNAVLVRKRSPGNYFGSFLKFF